MKDAQDKWAKEVHEMSDEKKKVWLQDHPPEVNRGVSRPVPFDYYGYFFSAAIGFPYDNEEAKAAGLVISSTLPETSAPATRKAAPPPKLKPKQVSTAMAAKMSAISGLGIGAELLAKRRKEALKERSE